MYNERSNFSGNGRGDRRGDHRGDHRGNRGQRGRGGHRYGDQPRGQFRGNRFAGSDNQSTTGSRPSGSNGLAPVAKADLPYAKVEFVKRPATMVQEKRLGSKLEVLTNHAIVRLPQQSLTLYAYHLDIVKNRKVLNKREQASPVFWEIFNTVRRDVRMTPDDIIFNDVNSLWSLRQLPDSEGTLSPPMKGGKGAPRSQINYKYTGKIEFGGDSTSQQDQSLTATLLDTIATSRVRHPNAQAFSVFKRLMFLVGPDDVENPEASGLYIKWGLDARLGVSLAFKMNLRAGITTCFDIGHTLFTKPCYPLIRLMIELIENEVISDEDYEAVWDTRLQNVRPDRANRELMRTILHGMSLTYCMEPALGMDYAKKRNNVVEPIQRGRGARDPRASKDFKFYDIGGSADEEVFTLQAEGNAARREISVAQYYLEQYNITLRYPNLPCIQKKPSKMNPTRILFPMEMVSFIVNPTRYEGFAPDGLKAQLVRDTTYSARQRKQLLEQVIAQRAIGGAPIVNNKDNFMTMYNVEIGTEMLKSQATILPPPTLIYGNGVFTDSEHDGQWEAVTHNPVRTILDGGDKERSGERKKVIVGSMIIVHHPANPDTTVNFDMESYNRIMRALNSVGQNIFWLDKEKGVPMCLDVYHHRKTLHPDSLRKYIQSVKDHVETDERYKHEDFVVVPLFFLLFEKRCTLYPNTNNDYNLLKFFCDNTLGVYSQGILVDNFNTILPNPANCKMTRHIVEKILGKIGTTHRKVQRGTSHRSWTILTDPDAPTLVLGVDVSHPKTADRLEPSIPGADLSVASVVGNIDTEMMQFRSSPRIQDAGEEQIVRMEEQMLARFNDFISNTKKRPAHVVVYRDGICEGDFQRIMYEELNSLQNACEQIAADYKPTITYIVVSKRHHTKFFPVNPDVSYEKHDFNVKPGTLIEDVVTSTKYYDFFLATQISEQNNTIKPTHYYVLRDDWAPMDSFWPTITHAFTYNFCRTTTTIALPAPVMYAHLAAKRAKETFEAACYMDFIHNTDSMLESGRGQFEKTGQITMNPSLDGMIFV